MTIISCEFTEWLSADLATKSGGRWVDLEWFFLDDGAELGIIVYVTDSVGDNNEDVEEILKFFENYMPQFVGVNIPEREGPRPPWWVCIKYDVHPRSSRDNTIAYAHGRGKGIQWRPVHGSDEDLQDSPWLSGFGKRWRERHGLPPLL